MIAVMLCSTPTEITVGYPRVNTERKNCRNEVPGAVGSRRFVTCSTGYDGLSWLCFDPQDGYAMLSTMLSTLISTLLTPLVSGFTPPPTAVEQTSEERGPEVFADVRFLDPRPLPGDPFLVALRIHDGRTEEKPKKRLKPMQTNELKFEMIDPQGGLHVARFPSAEISKLSLRPVGDTILFVADAKEVNLYLGESLDQKPPIKAAKWRKEEEAPLDLKGRWKLQFSGILQYADSKEGASVWVEGWFDVHRQSEPNEAVGVQDLLTKAEAAIASEVKGAKLKGEQLVWLGEEDGGRSVLRYGRSARGLVPIYRAAFDASGELVEVTRHSVRSKRSKKKFDRDLDDVWLRLWPAERETLVPPPAVEGPAAEDNR